MAVNYRAIDRDVRWNLSLDEGAGRGPEGAEGANGRSKGSGRDRASVVQ